jgi:hypothetical protein
MRKKFLFFLISNFCRVLYVVCFLLDNSRASEFYMPTFLNTLFTYLPMKMENIECSETSAYKIQTPGNYPEENIQQISVCCEDHTKHTITLRGQKSDILCNKAGGTCSFHCVLNS